MIERGVSRSAGTLSASQSADAQKLVAYTHYAPLGTRSFGPIRALLYGGAGFVLGVLAMHLFNAWLH